MKHNKMTSLFYFIPPPEKFPLESFPFQRGVVVIRCFCPCFFLKVRGGGGTVWRGKFFLGMGALLQGAGRVGLGPFLGRGLSMCPGRCPHGVHRGVRRGPPGLHQHPHSPLRRRHPPPRPPQSVPHVHNSRACASLKALAPKSGSGVQFLSKLGASLQ